ncbi:hypothetical protein DS909_17120 [Phaeobacter gallaeciensis]|uniref:Sulfotransferase domain-containing protein n=2 Tax=Roseobacteraceae TaxID=2854170 RepID=A0A366WUI2_9RHOB|nr:MULTISPECIES: hypothetical protein [Roseobacteraceae]MBT3140048.1 hypothetical protein [Falsiruegeria litorea]MBT8167232.1 hypothetical protein [Falsiruegeria litorea]RBW52441.1 hypothetical protein DS909_17120 [Phaeobacter gallaeciensis]
MARVVLHIGTYKTGTTYLQTLCHLNRAQLAQAGVIYPPCGDGYAQHGLAALWLDVPDAVASAQQAGGAQALWQTLTDRYARAPGTLFLSSELFSHWGRSRIDLADLASRLSAFEDICLVYSLRQQADLAQSIWLQAAKFKSPRPIHRFVRKAFERRQIEDVRLDHASVHETLLGHFSHSQIKLVDYHQASRSPGGIGQTFLDLLDAGLDVSQLTPPPPESVNTSPAPLTYWVATQITRGQQQPSEKLIRLVHQALGLEQGQPTSLLARYEYQKFQSRFGPGNAALVARVQNTQPGFSFAEGSVPKGMMFRDDVTQAHWAEIAALLYNERAQEVSFLERLRKRWRLG